MTRSGAHNRLMILVCFGLASLSFLGASLYANLRLGRVAELTHQVSDNAMPSLARIGAMRYELANVGRALGEAAEGEGGGPGGGGRGPAGT